MKKYIIGAVLLAVIFAFYQVLSVGSTVIHKGTYTIQEGDTASSIPKRFNIDVNNTLYKIWLKTVGINPTLKAGNFNINKDISLSELLQKSLNNPQALEDEITILPGRNIYDIDESLSTKGIINKGDLISFSENIPADIMSKYTFLKGVNSLEGFLYPDTYRIPKDAKIGDIVLILLSEFKSKVADNFKLNGTKLYNDMIMASIVQKEERNKENQPIVAGILLKRIESGIAIGADATVCYSYKKTSLECTPAFIGTKIHTRSSYNTRSQLGLPPTPISNFTSDTFGAVFSPEVSPYYYYLHDNEGYIHFAKTLDEHVRNKNLYLK